MRDLNLITALEIFKDVPELNFRVSYGYLLWLVREGTLGPKRTSQESTVYKSTQT